MKKVRVALVQPVQAPYWTERLRYLAESHNLEIFLLLERETFDNRPGWRPEPIPGVTTFVLGSQVKQFKTVNSDMGYAISDVQTIPWRLSKVLMSIKPDVVVVCNAKQLLCSLLARWRLRFVLSLIVEDTPHSTRNHNTFQFFLKTFLYRRADAWMPFNKDAKIFLRKLGINKSLYPSSWSVDSNKFLPEKEARTQNDKLVISVVSALIERKGIMQLLEAWNSIASEYRESFVLKIAGTGPLEKTIEQYLSKNDLDDVILLGHISYDNIVLLLQSSILSVLPTLEDVYGMTVLEAMACGCAVITTPYAGARELVDEGVDGWISDPMNRDELASTLLEAMEDVGRLKNMGLNARNKTILKDNKKIMKEFEGKLVSMAIEC